MVVMSLVDNDERTFASNLLLDAKQSIIEYVMQNQSCIFTIKYLSITVINILSLTFQNEVDNDNFIL